MVLKNSHTSLAKGNHINSQTTISKGQLNFLQNILACSKEMTFALDLDTRILILSQEGYRILGLKSSEEINNCLSEFINQESNFDKFLEQVEVNGKSTGEIQFQSRKGQKTVCNLCLTKWLTSSGEHLGYIGIAQDLSEWKKFQENLIRIDRLAEIGILSAGIVHDLKNPLSIINQATGWAEVVVEDAKGLNLEDRNELTKTLQEIQKQTSRCKTITNQVLDFVRETKPKINVFDVRELLTETINYLHPELKFHPIKINTNFSPDPVRIDSDYKLFQQVVINLLSNAIYAVREKNQGEGIIELTTQVQKNQVYIYIQDNGQGIPEYQQKKIFDLFYTTKPPGKGTGLGLSMCRNIIQKLGGEISFTSQEGQGTTFTITMPLSV